MATKSKRATVYFDAELHRALRLKAAETEQSMSDLVNEAVRVALLEDAEDLQAARNRVGEPTVSFESLVSDLKARGKL
ncbi:MAG: CopG family transcriptional regulator [Rhodothermales bacterium]|nr:CopG family transcriptional regulator [Rhodothermales bacterium]